MEALFVKSGSFAEIASADDVDAAADDASAVAAPNDDALADETLDDDDLANDLADEASAVADAVADEAVAAEPPPPEDDAKQRAETIAKTFISGDLSGRPSKLDLTEVARRVIVDREGKVADAMARAKAIADKYWIDAKLLGRGARKSNQGDVMEVARIAAETLGPASRMRPIQQPSPPRKRGLRGQRWAARCSRTQKFQNTWRDPSGIPVLDVKPQRTSTSVLDARFRGSIAVYDKRANLLTHQECS